MAKDHPYIKYAFLALPLSFLGIPIYIHLPKFYYEHFGLSLTYIGAILFLSRILDAVIDPFIGVISDKYNLSRKKFFIFFSIFLAIFFNSFFYLPASLKGEYTAIWFSFCTIFVYLFFSIVYINFYNLGLMLARDSKSRIRLSSYRELCGFVGMITASALPALLAYLFGSELTGFRVYGLVFCSFIIFSLYFLPRLDHQLPSPQRQTPKKGVIRYIITNKDMRGLIILYFINSLPMAITSNLFSFYVDEYLQAETLSALFLLIYLLSGALCATLCTKFSAFSKGRILLLMMIFSAIGFSLTCFITPEYYWLFFIVCILSGFGLGGELVILPAIAADILKDHPNCGNSFFAIWASCTKITLAFAAGVFLPLISSDIALLADLDTQTRLTFFYTIIPLTIKLAVIAYVATRQKVSAS